MSESQTEVKTEEIGLVFAHHLDPARQLPRTSVYLDDEERRKAEDVRARIEGREPDHENSPATQGTPLKSVAEIERTLPYGAKIDPEFVIAVPVSTEGEEVSSSTEADELRYEDGREIKDHPEDDPDRVKNPDNGQGSFDLTKRD